MGISDKDRKRLWAHSGNRCALCRARLVAEPTEEDSEAVVGDEAHISARSPGGSRYGTCTPEMVDTYDNLILLCRTDHKKVDDQPGHYTPERLHAMKRDHHAWVDGQLDGQLEDADEVVIASAQINVFTGRGSVTWPVHVGRPPLSADCLQERPEETVALERALTREVGRGPETAIVSSVLSGMGGVGKTQLAAAIHRSWYAGVGAEGLALWATADSRDAIITAFAEAASAVSDSSDPPVPENREAAATWFLNWLSATDRPWLVVLDDLGDPGDLRKLWPEGPNGACLVTTRRTDNVLGGRGRIVVPVGLFSPEQSRAYLTEKFSILAENASHALEGADQLADDLQHLPLALAQAAAYISDRPGETCASYGARLADRRHRLGALFPDDALADDYQLTVSATWSISVEGADRLSPGGLARPLLEVASLLDPNGIPIEVLISPPAVMYAKTANPQAAPA